MNYSNIAILIVTHNHSAYIKDLIDSCSMIPEIEKYICDAASSDNSHQILENEIKAKKNFFLMKKENLESFSKNNNDIIRKYSLQGRDIILINPDCHFERNSFLSFINIVSKIERLGVAAPTLHYPNKSLQKSWRSFPSLMGFIKNRFSRKYSIQTVEQQVPGGIYEIQWALGAFLYISRNLNQTPPLDERYRLYCEDSDICMRAHTEKLRVIGINILGIYHALQEKSTSSIISRYNYWNLSSGIKFALKWNTKYFSITRNLPDTPRLISISDQKEERQIYSQ